LTQVERPTADFIQQAIHGGKCLTGVQHSRRESPVRGQTVMEAPGEENGLVNLIVVGKPASVERHREIVRRKLRKSHQKSRGRPGGRPRTRGSAPPSNRIRITFMSRTRVVRVRLAANCRLARSPPFMLVLHSFRICAFDKVCQVHEHP
jgi:hypothetical protein